MLQARFSKLLLCSLLSLQATAASAQELVLSAADKRYLDGLLKDHLFDPRGAERVAVKMTACGGGTQQRDIFVEGWLVPGMAGTPARVYFADGASMPALPANELTRVDFAASCRQRFLGTAPQLNTDEERRRLVTEEVARRVWRTAPYRRPEASVILAAWLYRLGHEGLAARAMAARSLLKNPAYEDGRTVLAGAALVGLADAYGCAADALALAHGERLERLAPELLKTDEFAEARAFLTELRRRQCAGIFGKRPDERQPADFASWTTNRKLTYLFASLEDIGLAQLDCSPKRFVRPPRDLSIPLPANVVELVKLGDAAVPSLIDALEKDERLTRNVQLWGTESPTRCTISVRDYAAQALHVILRVRALDPLAAEPVTLHYGRAHAYNARLYRRYWQDYGRLPFDERMMKILTDPKTHRDARYEAMRHLAALHEESPVDRIIVETFKEAAAPRQPHPAVAKFSKPTVAEAILAGLDRDLKQLTPDQSLAGNDRAGLLAECQSALLQLGDRRVAPKVLRRATEAANLSERIGWQIVAFHLGQEEPLRATVADFRAGKIKQADAAIASLGAACCHVGSPELERAYTALCDHKHPQYRAVLQHLQTPHPHASFCSRHDWLSHSQCLGLLRHALDDTTPTGKAYRIVGAGLFAHWTDDGYNSLSLPGLLHDPTNQRHEAAGRICDAAALKLNDLVLGLPEYHPLCMDADQRLANLKTAFDRYADRYRQATWREKEVLGVEGESVAYVPDIRPLQRPATAADVRAGRAIFHLDGKGKRAKQELPAVGLWPPGTDRDSNFTLVVQAEVNARGETVYGIIERHAIRMVPARELDILRTFAQLDRE